ncbi:MAG: hypothetical protein H7Z75_07590 [Ferruginibacter sp.]|nr:hypothetical protein [Cytophagales bacterium]
MRIKSAFLLCTVLATLGACGVARQLNELKNFARCDFRLKTMENTTLGGVDVQQVRSVSDLNLLQAGKIAAAYAGGSLPLDFILNVDVKNPNASPAAMNRMEWILLIDDVEITNGNLTDRIEIAPNSGITTLPIRIRADLRKALTGKSSESTINFGLNLVGSGNRPSRLTLKVKPSIMVGNTAINYPGYLSVGNEFGGAK